jgi:hypothetical protein
MIWEWSSAVASRATIGPDLSLRRKKDIENIVREQNEFRIERVLRTSREAAFW